MRPERLILGTRLRAVADRVPRGALLADIGCDHARLPAVLLHAGHVRAAIAIDNSPQPLAAARAWLSQTGITGVELRLADGLLGLCPGEADTLAFAGMGGARIVELLEAAPAVVAAANRIVVQPNTSWERVRDWAMQSGRSIANACIEHHRGQFYWTAAIEHAPHVWTDADLRLGPFVRRAGGEGFAKWVAHERAWLNKLAQRLRRTRSASPTHSRVRAIEAAQARLEAALAAPCW